jgi:hypothetical protein
VLAEERSPQKIFLPLVSSPQIPVWPRNLLACAKQSRKDAKEGKESRAQQRVEERGKKIERGCHGNEMQIFFCMYA